MKTSFIWSVSCGPETSIAKSKNYSEQLISHWINSVILAKRTKNISSKENNFLFYKLQHC